MGNISSMARASTALDSYVSELGNDISYEKSGLSSSRFLKSIVARHKNGPLVLKIFIKPDAGMSLRVIQRRLKQERDSLANLSNVNTYATFIETEKAGYLLRQWIASSLYDRLSTQPYLTDIEKKWIAFQLLTCLRDARTAKVAHGDIKSDNVLVASDLTVLVTDFSSAFKPTYLPLDDPSDFSFFFDTSARRTCYIAPERFYDSNSQIAQEKRAASVSAKASDTNAEPWEKRDARITEEMDVFSAGCVLAETWTDGRTVFNLSELFAYRDGSLGLDGILDNLEDADVRSMIAQMLSRDPSDRPTFDRILTTYRGTIFPEYFYTFLKDYVAELAELPDSPNAEFLQRGAALPGTKIDRMLEQWGSISVYLDSRGSNDSGPALLLLNVVTSSIRNCLSPSSRLNGLRLFLNLASHLPDEDKIDRVVPYVVTLLSDETAIVRAEACRTLVLVIESVTSVTQRNATFIHEYLLPHMGRLATDQDIFVRATYARALVRLADAAVRMLELSQASKPLNGETTATESDYELMLAEVQSVVEEQTSQLLMDNSSQVKRGVLDSIADLCLFFGRQKSSETVLSHIMTYLNDRDWQLRLAFFDGIVAVGAFIGIRAIDEYVLPLMLQALADPEEAVVARVIVSLSSLSSLGLLPRLRLWEVFWAVHGFLYHPNAWIRQGAAGFVAAAARNLPPSDVWCILYPAVRQALRCDIIAVDEVSILDALMPPLSRATLQLARAAALQNVPPGFWNVAPTRGSVKSLMTTAAAGRGDTTPDFHQLRDSGFTPKDETKIFAMREYIAKQAQATRAREGSGSVTPPEALLTTGKSISLIGLGVTPQTVFLSPRTVGLDTRNELKRLRPDLGIGTPSRRTSVASRGKPGADNPIDQLRMRLASLDATARSDSTEPLRVLPDVAPSPSGSGISSALDVTAVTRSVRGKPDSKAPPALKTVHTTVQGTTTLHDSGRSSPVPPTIGVTPAPYTSTYDGADPGVRAYLEQVDLQNYREPLLDFGPRIVPSHRKRGPRSKSSVAQAATMIAHLPQHTGPVTALVTSPDQLFFASASEDSSILIWDSGKLERTVAARPRLTYRMDAPISAMCGIAETHCLAAAAEDGSLHIVRIHASSAAGSVKYRSVECIRTWATSPGDGYVTHVSHLQESTILIVMSSGIIATLDLRTMALTSRLQHPLELGPVSAVCATPNWIVVGTVSGALSLWDLRFGLILKSWSASAGVAALALHPTRGRGRHLLVTVERNSSDEDVPLVETYDIETGQMAEVYEVRNGRPTPRAPPAAKDVLQSKSELIAELAGGGGLPDITGDAQPATALALLTGSAFASLQPLVQDEATLSGWVVSAGSDRVIRYWDVARGDGFVLCGSQRDKDVSFNSVAGTPTINYTVPNTRQQSYAQGHAASLQRQPLRPHYDAVCALGVVETPFSSCIISADRSGVIKVWRIEGGRPM